MLLALLLLLGCEAEVDSCAVVQEEYLAELAELQHCDTVDDCGYPIPGTGCGCTRNLVANNDADTSELYDIMQIADDLHCEVVAETSCDCPEASGFVCEDHTCGWDYVD